MPAQGRDGAPAAEALRVRGVVQGVGFRPFVYGLATAMGLCGWVRNTSSGVEIEVEGPPEVVSAFARRLRAEAPPRARVTGVERAPAQPTGARSFVIRASSVDPDAYQLVSPDIALCDDCRRELLDPFDRRYRYPFTNCTSCGPRFTIIESLPYDRERTTMRSFTLCPDCRREYEDPADRRFHAEPNACPVCGPRVWLVEGDASAPPPARPADSVPPGDSGAAKDPAVAVDPAAAIDRAAELLCSGAIVAIKGLGGFHLACDATDGAAVEELKKRKGRPHKPLAVMFADIGQVRAHCRCSAAEQALLTSPQHPIVLLEWPVAGEGSGTGAVNGADGSGTGAGSAAGAISGAVAVRQRYLGAMLPYTPLHLLLMRAAGRPLVMTSGNLAEEPIVKGWEEAGRLAGIADAYLLHDREIHARYDDSVAQVRGGRVRLMRRSRGYAPFPLSLPRPLPQLLACGAELKNTFCLTRDDNAFLSQHIGDLENLETLEHFEASIELYKRHFRLAPEVLVHDLHPEYLSTKYALAQGQECIGVQHHHAHIAACMVENGQTGPVIGVSMDGLGYGADGRLWGGEVLVCDLLGYERVAHLEDLPLPGGKLAVERPARTAAGWLLALLGERGLERGARLLGQRGARLGDGSDGDGLSDPGLGDAEIAAVAAQVSGGVNAPLTSSCGRLFDAVAALAGVRGRITYEGQAAIELEMISTPGADPYPYVIDNGAEASATSLAGGQTVGPAPPLVVRLAPLFAALLDDLEAGREPGCVGSRLHATIAAMVLDLCCRLRADRGLVTVALSGGCFQNRLLSDLCEAALGAAGFAVLSHSLVPANDGGLSLGQAVVGGYTLLERRGQLQ